MANGSLYPAEMIDGNNDVRIAGSVQFTDSTNQPQAGSNPITSGTLPVTAASWTSTTAKVNPVAYAVTVYLAIVGDATNNAATCLIEVSPDNVTYTGVGTYSLAAAVNNTGAITAIVPVRWPQGWYIKLTLAHTTVAASYYY